MFCQFNIIMKSFCFECSAGGEIQEDVTVKSVMSMLNDKYSRFDFFYLMMTKETQYVI